ncbi:hypothetical protein F8M41_010871 [Gigaspora margarita]|uniref:Uncharacterized protein n=1 Tax=Gigaspora margarita TaxID=4874 RepID=A0A8H4A2W7_GIGMA|nr:hypothetical protein F8M41_010871 [Gigaspora margarita]
MVTTKSTSLSTLEFISHCCNVSKKNQFGIRYHLKLKCVYRIPVISVPIQDTRGLIGEIDILETLKSISLEVIHKGRRRGVKLIIESDLVRTLRGVQNSPYRLKGTEELHNKLGGECVKIGKRIIVGNKFFPAMPIYPKLFRKDMAS